MRPDRRLRLVPADAHERVEGRESAGKLTPEQRRRLAQALARLLLAARHAERPAPQAGRAA